MKEKLLAALAAVKSWAEWLYAKSPLAVGILIGYLGHPLVKVGVDLVAGLLRGLLG